MLSRWRQESAAGASIFRRRLDAELAQLLDESRAAQIEETGSVRNGAIGALEGLLDQRALDRQQVRPQVEAGLGQGRQCSGRAGLGRARRGDGNGARLEELQRVLFIEHAFVVFDGRTLVFPYPALGWTILRWQILDLHDAPAGGDRQPLDEIAELADVAGP